MSTLNIKHEFPFELQNPGLIKDGGLINGEWGTGKATKTFDIFAPATEKHIGSLPEMGKEDVADALEAAETAFASYKKVSEYERSRILTKIANLIRENMEDLVKLVSLENGKALAESRAELNGSAGFFDWYAGEAIRNYGDIVPSNFPGARHLILKQPVGVTSIMAPWNFPVSMIARKLAPALAAGCTTVIKPASETPYSAMAMVVLAEAAGVPKGVINFILTHEKVAEVGKELCENPRVRHVSFTGSTRVGKILLGQASNSVARVSMELGGNAPLIVFDDADLPKAVAGALASKFRQAGQTCVCANRILVQESIHDKFVDEFVKQVAKFKLGDPLDAETNFGAMIHSNSPDTMDSLVKDATSKGAKVLIGGKKPARPGYFYEATVLDGVSPDAECFVNEIFGPIAPIVTFKTDEEAIALANKVSVGLASYIFSTNASRLWRAAEAIETGMVGANTGSISEPAMAFGGVKQSGMGREGSKYGLAEYQELKNVVYVTD